MESCVCYTPSGWNEAFEQKVGIHVDSFDFTKAFDKVSFHNLNYQLVKIFRDPLWQWTAESFAECRHQGLALSSRSVSSPLMVRRANRVWPMMMEVLSSSNPLLVLQDTIRRRRWLKGDLVTDIVKSWKGNVFVCCRKRSVAIFPKHPSFTCIQFQS